MPTPTRRRTVRQTARAPRAPRRDGAKTRERLVAAAAEVFNDVGYFGTDSNRIARAAGYAPATFYKHFENKRAIFLATYEQWVAAEWESIRTELAGRRSGSLARVVRLVLDHHRRWATFRCSLRALAATDRVVRAFRIEQREAQLKLMEEMLAGGRRGPSRARCLVALLTFERVCDAVADGETEALSIPEAAIVRDLKTELEALFPTP